MHVCKGEGHGSLLDRPVAVVTRSLRVISDARDGLMTPRPNENQQFQGIVDSFRGISKLQKHFLMISKASKAVPHRWRTAAPTDADISYSQTSRSHSTPHPAMSCGDRTPRHTFHPIPIPFWWYFAVFPRIKSYVPTQE